MYKIEFETEIDDKWHIDHAESVETMDVEEVENLVRECSEVRAIVWQRFQRFAMKLTRDDVFKWSTPAEKTQPWRVSDSNAMRSLLTELGYSVTGGLTVKSAYVEHDGGTDLHIGLRDNTDAWSHAIAVADLLKELIELGFRAEPKRHTSGLLWAIKVVDHDPA